ncbi:zeaxanthin glucosyl transferase [Rhodopirellula sallentina SM41]|uniref:Zeaxanthin glucosyl transferase n=2 Tax=Rhodopirellula TaxID=265488 RepID=M5U4J8_9BACT|nr:zeaxanthin glucosyl transferase [Rhodopirellula sallentina SM41]
MFSKVDAQEATLKAGISFRVIGESEFPKGSMVDSLARLGQLKGRAGLSYTVDLFNKNARVFLRDAPGELRRSQVDALIVDQATPEAGSVAEYLNIPFVNLCSAVVLNRADTVPTPFAPWDYNPSILGRVRNRIGYAVSKRLLRPVLKTIDDQRKQWSLPPHRAANDRFSTLAQISQQPVEFEFPRADLPSWFHFTGPFHSHAGRPVVDFPYERLTDQSLVYASLGTIHGNGAHLFSIIARACMGLDVQLVISLGGSSVFESIGKLPGDPIVVRYAPQLELLKKTALMITHGGMNTTLECLNNAVPMVAIPMANDQPGIGARVKWTGCGESLPAKNVNVAKLRTAIEKVLGCQSYRRNAKRLQAAIARSGGVTRTADIVEKAATTRQPVLA